jgi:hypothetical protein
MSYKEAIIKAIKELNAGDGSTVARIKKFMKENDLSEQTTWNDRVFHLSLATLVLVGDLDEAKTANYKLSSEYILKCQAKSMFSIDLRNRGEMLLRAGCMRRAMLSRLKYDLNNADRFTAVYLNEQGLTPDVVAKLREVEGWSKEEKDLEIEAFELGLKALGKRIISVQALGDVLYSALWDPENEDFTPTHMDDATYEALIEHSDYAAEHPEELMLQVSNAVPSRINLETYCFCHSTHPNHLLTFFHTSFIFLLYSTSLEIFFSRSTRRSTSDNTCAFMTSRRWTFR